jgi:hypothetical protein
MKTIMLIMCLLSGCELHTVDKVPEGAFVIETLPVSLTQTTSVHYTVNGADIDEFRSASGHLCFLASEYHTVSISCL